MIAVPNRLLDRPAAPAVATGAAAPVVVMLGSNIEPERHLPEAVRQLASLGAVAAVSSVWQTAPIGYTEQPDFCNAAVLLETVFTPVQLLRRLRGIEDRLGRVRDPRNKNAPRTIDLDLGVIPGPPRVVGGRMFPDPEIAERVFLAVPLEEVLPSFILPDGRGIQEVATALQKRDGERLRLARCGEIRLG